MLFGENTCKSVISGLQIVTGRTNKPGQYRVGLAHPNVDAGLSQPWETKAACGETALGTDPFV
jgi:hypothetical protein